MLNGVLRGRNRCQMVARRRLTMYAFMPLRWSARQETPFDIGTPLVYVYIYAKGNSSSRVMNDVTAGLQSLNHFLDLADFGALLAL